MLGDKRNWAGRWRSGLAALLAVATLPLSPAALAAGDNAIVPKVSLANKPEVTIQGNVVVDDTGAPTGFYELALCVRSPKRIVDMKGLTDDPRAPGNAVAPGTEISESAYETYLAANPESEGDFTVTYYPFAAASAAVEINADVLTAVNWDVASVTYGEWDATANAYQDAALDAAYPRGIDLTPTAGGNYDPDVWSDTDPAPFPDITTATLQGLHRLPVALDAEGDRSAFTAAAQVDDYSETTKAALVTLSAHAPDNKPVIYTTSTPVAVVRFAYDLARFPKGTVMVNAAAGDLRNQVTGTAANEGFWLGLDRGNNTTVNSGKTPLTWLADTAQGTGGNSYDYSDARAAASEAGQTVWTKLSSKDSNGTPMAEWVDTEYYYYLGGENPGGTGAEGTVAVATATGVQNVEHVWTPNTASRIKILAEGTDENPMPGAGDAWTQAGYSYYSNLISLNGGLELELVNALTFRKPTGEGGDTVVLFFDWDDVLMGDLIINSKKDCRKQINSYIERNFIHPDLRASQYFEGDSLPAAGSQKETDYKNVVDSTAREYTYRGSRYPYTVDNNTSHLTPGADKYYLTNKLDYVFYKRLNIVNTVRTPDPADPTNAKKDTVENYYTVAPVSADADGGLYPYIYGWAIIEDPANEKIETAGEDWALRLDSVKTEDTWTTFLSGELGTANPKYLSSGKTGQPIPAGSTETQPGGLSAPLTHTGEYDYMTSTADDNGYLRFADFSDVSAMLKPGQNVLLVKAVYEPGDSLLPDDWYTVVDGSLYYTRYGTNASTMASTYSMQFQYQRATNLYGQWQGVLRTRDPLVQTGLTYDVNAFDSEDGSVDLDPENDTNLFYVQNFVSNTDIMDVDLTAGGAIWKVDHILVDLYPELNVATGTQRTVPEALVLKNGFKYPKPVKSGEPEGSDGNWTYAERQGTDGFVVRGTINALVEKATEIHQGSTESLSSYFSLATVQDLNLRRDMTGANFSIANYGNAAKALQALVDAVLTRYPDPKAPGVPAGLFNNRGYLDLSWHQLQKHIIMYQGGNTAGIFDGTSLMSDADCAGYPWCRMDLCTADVKMDINTMGDLLQAIYYTQSLPPTDSNHKRAEEALKLLTGAQLNAYGWRIQADGVPYDYDPTITDAALKSAILGDLEEAVKALTPTLGAEPDWSTVTWTQVQKEIVYNNMKPTVPATLNLWWEPSEGKPYGTPPTPTTWEDVLRYSYAEYVGVDLDGDGTPDAKVPHAFENFTGDKVTLAQLERMIDGHVEGKDTGDYANMGWLRKELDSNDECVKFADADEFAAAWKKAVEVLAAPAPAGGGYDSPDKLKACTWEELQYAVMTGTYKSYADILEETSGKAEGPLKGKDLYWNDNGQPKLKLEQLLKAVSIYAFTGSDAELQEVLGGSIDPVNNVLFLRKTDPMGRFESIDEFKSIARDAIVALYNSGSDPKYFGSDGQTLTMDWEEFQWLLLNYPTMTTQPDGDTIRNDPSIDYWWKGGGSPKNPMEIESITDLMLSALWCADGTLSTALDKLKAEDLERLGLWGDERGLPFPATMTDAQAIQLIKDAVQNFPYTTATLSSKSEAELKKELQYAIFNANAYLPAASITDEYWWQGEDGPAITDQESLLKAAWLYYVGDGAGTTTSRALDEMPQSMDFINKREIGLAMRQDSEGAEFADVDTFLAALETVLKSGVTYEQATSMTNYQLQYMLLGGAYKSDEAVKAEVIDTTDPENPIDDYWWFTKNKKPGTDDRKEIALDQAKWDDFIQSAAGYYQNWDAASFTFSPLNDAVIKDDLLLRLDDSGTEIRASDLFCGNPDGNDLIMQTIEAIANASNGGEYFEGAPSYAMVKAPTWYQFQYALIHRKDLTTLPSDAACQAECEDKWDWKYESGTKPPDPPTPPEPEKEEIEVDPARWSAFMQSAGAYNEQWSAGAFTFSPFDDTVVKDELLLRLDEAGTVIAAKDLFCGNPDGNDLIIQTMEAIYNASNGGDYIDQATYALKQELSWYQFQYCLIHRGSLSAVPDEETAKAECKEKYDWKYKDGEVTPPEPPTPPEKVENTLDQAQWDAFIQAAGAYNEQWSASAFTYSPLDDTVIRDVLQLRANDDGTEIRAADLFCGNPDGNDLIMQTLDAIYNASNGGDYIDQSTYAMIKAPSWYQFQYCLINRASLTAVPDDATAKAECEAKWAWRYQEVPGGGGGGEEPDPPTPPTPTKSEIPVDAATWKSFIQAAGAYNEQWSASAFTFSPFNDAVVKDNLLLRLDDVGTVVTASQLFCGNPDGNDLIMQTMDAIYNASNGGDYIDQGSYALKQELSWYQFQYCLINRGSLTAVPDEAAAKAECEAKWDWKYKESGSGSGGGGGGGEEPDPPTPVTKTEKPVDAATWDSFIQSAGAYHEQWSASAFTFSPMNDTVVKDTLLLRGDDGGTVITSGQLFCKNPDGNDLIMQTMTAIYNASNGSEYIDQGTYAMIKVPTWYQFQYALIHRGSLSSLPDDATCKAECEAKWDWKYDTSGGSGGGGEDPDPPTPPTPGGKTEIPVDAATWDSFIQSAGAYHEQWSASAFTFSPMNDTVVKDTLLLRGDDGGTVITAGQLFCKNPDGNDLIMQTMTAIYEASNGSEYIDQGSYAMIKAPTWYQFQYALIHRASLSSLPDDATCKAECEAKWDWKYTTG